MKKKAMPGVIAVVLLNLFVLYIRPRHIAPDFILWFGGLVTGVYIGSIAIMCLEN